MGANGGEGDEVSASGSVILPLLRSRRAQLGERRRQKRQGEFRLCGATLHSLSAAEAATWLVRQAAGRPLAPVIATHVVARDLRVLRRRQGILAALAAGGRILPEGRELRVLALAAGHGWRRGCDRTVMAGIVFERCAHFGIPVYLLGGGPGIIGRVVQGLRRHHPHLRIAGARHGTVPPRAEERIARRIRDSGATLLVQGRGSPLQEEFALRWGRALGVWVVWNVGGLFASLAGERPPRRWMRRARLEWAFRLSCALRRGPRRSSAA